MKRGLLVLFGWLLGGGLALAEPAAALEPGVPATVYLAPGRATTVLLHSRQKIAAISLASPVVTYKYDRALNQLELTPAVRTGGVETNLNLRIGRSVYILLLKVVEDVRAQYLRDFTLADEAADDDEGGLGSARPLAPADIDVVAAARTMARWRSDPVFRQAHPTVRVVALDRRYLWNDCLVTLAEVAQFTDQDVLVFRVAWVNRTPDAIYLDARQYGLFVAGHRIPIGARYQPAADAIVYPGQAAGVYLAVQGYRLSRHNDWVLGLPPEAAALNRRSEAP